MTERHRRWVLVGMVGLAFALRVAGLDFQSLWRDEVDAIRFASEPIVDLLGKFAQPGHNGPLYFLVLRYWLRATGQSAFALRFFSAFWGVLAVPLGYRLGRRLFPARPLVALLSALFLATSSYLVWYGQEGKMYALVTTLIMLSMDRYLEALERGGWRRWLVYLAVTSLAFYVHLTAALVVPAQALIYLVLGRRLGAGRWKPWLASMAILTLPYLPLLIWQLPLLLQRADTGYKFVPLPDMILSLAVSYSLGVVEGMSRWSLVPFVALWLAAGLWGLSSQRWRASLWILTCWLAVPVFGFFLITLVRPMYTARYLIYVLPAYLILLAFAAAAIGRRSKLAAGLILFALLAVNGWGIWRQARLPLKADFRGATHYVIRRLAREDLVVFQIPHGRYSFDYYAQLVEPRPSSPPALEGTLLFLPLVSGGGGQAYRWADGLYTNAGMSLGEVDRRMSELTAGSRVIWLVATETSLWDERDLVRAWLDGHAELTAQADFVRVTVYRYERPG